MDGATFDNLPREEPRSTAARARKPTIMLDYEDDAIGIAKRLLFEAETPAVALDIAKGEAAGRQARLFVDGEPLCSLLKADDEHPYWIVAGSPAWQSGEHSQPSKEEP